MPPFLLLDLGLCAVQPADDAGAVPAAARRAAANPRRLSTCSSSRCSRSFSQDTHDLFYPLYLLPLIGVSARSRPLRRAAVRLGGRSRLYRLVSACAGRSKQTGLTAARDAGAGGAGAAQLDPDYYPRPDQRPGRALGHRQSPYCRASWSVKTEQVRRRGAPPPAT